MADKILSVSQVNNYIQKLFDANAVLRRVQVEGELSGITRAASGHLYFSLKDAGSEIRCVMWKSTADRLRFAPENGQSVYATGAVQSYPRRGSYQINVTKLEPAGIGTLYLLYEQMVKKLKAHGWFEPEIKKPLPNKITRIGVVTSESGAVIHDIITTINRRDPTMEILLVPAKVQGDGAAEEIAKAIQTLNARSDTDVIIVGRGGGSMEDLWAFNELPVAQAIHDSTIPVISAVGHETDTTVADFTADLRAATPTAAAELATPENRLPFVRTALYEELLPAVMTDKIDAAKRTLDACEVSLAHHSPAAKLESTQQYLDELEASLTRNISHKLALISEKTQRLAACLSLLNPHSVLARGYVLVTAPDGKLVLTAEQAAQEKTLTLHFADGNVDAKPKG